MSGMLNGSGVGTGLSRVYTDPLDGLNTVEIAEILFLYGPVLQLLLKKNKKNIILSYTKVGIEQMTRNGFLSLFTFLFCIGATVKNTPPTIVFTV